MTRELTPDAGSHAVSPPANPAAQEEYLAKAACWDVRTHLQFATGTAESSTCSKIPKT